MNIEPNWQSRAERAEAACCEKDAALKLADAFCCADPSEYHGSIAYLAEEVAPAIEHALSTDCGSDYVRREELDKLKARLDRLDAYPEMDENVQGFILGVLEQLEKRGVDTTNWDGDESSETIMASCIAGKIREKQQELDAAEQHVKILRKAFDDQCNASRMDAAEIEKLKRELDTAKGRLAHTEEALEACERASGFVPCDTSLPQWIENIVKERDESKLRLGNWCVQHELDEAKAELAKLRSRIRCVYCDAEYAFEQKEELADHILTCEKSPLVQANREIQSKAIDLLDLTRDEFIRIAAISDNSEIQGICARSQEMIEQKYPVIKQRDEFEKQLSALKAEKARLLKKLHTVKATLAYVAYVRLPLGNTVFDTLQEHWQRLVIEHLDPEEQALAGKEDK